MPLGLSTHANLSLHLPTRDTGMAWSINLQSKGNSKGILFQSHLVSYLTSLTSSMEATWVRGPWISRRRGPFFVQLLYQKFSLLSLPIIHILPFVRTSLPFLIAAQIREHGSLFALSPWCIFFSVEPPIQFSRKGNIPPFCCFQAKTTFILWFSHFMPPNPVYLYCCLRSTPQKISVNPI